MFSESRRRIGGEYQSLDRATRKMYEIPGHEEIALNHFQRYLQDKKRFEKESGVSYEECVKFRDRYLSVDYNQQCSMTLAALESRNTGVCAMAAKQAKSLMGDDLFFAWRTILSRPDAILYLQNASSTSDLTAEQEKIVQNLLAEKISAALLSNDERYWLNAARVIPFLSLEQDQAQASLEKCILRLLKKRDRRPTDFTVDALLMFLPWERQRNIVQSALKSDVPATYYFGAYNIGRFSEKEYEEFQKEILERVSTFFDSAKEDNLSYLAELIDRCPVADRPMFMRCALATSDPYLWCTASRGIEMIGDESPEKKELLRAIVAHARTLLESRKVQLWILGAVMASYIPGRERDDLELLIIRNIKESLRSGERAVIARAADVLQYLGPFHWPDAYKEFVQYAPEALIAPPLYQRAGFAGESSGTVSRRRFEKTGSETTLLGGSLQGKVIVRSISPESFLAWQRLYEDPQLWLGQGFDYVPIEPIISFRMHRDENTVDVASGVLDLHLGMWIKRCGHFARELEQEAALILRALRACGVLHGHTHRANFCLRFFRLPDGAPDLTKKPRIYLIDFDQAKFSIFPEQENVF